jgi:predicted DNA-binding transcriptional regulator AlpA
MTDKAHPHQLIQLGDHFTFLTGSDGLPVGFVRPQALALYLNVSVPTIYRWERENILPARARIAGIGCALWRWADIHAWDKANAQVVK